MPRVVDSTQRNHSEGCTGTPLAIRHVRSMTPPAQRPTDYRLEFSPLAWKQLGALPLARFRHVQSALAHALARVEHFQAGPLLLRLEDLAAQCEVHPEDRRVVVVHLALKSHREPSSTGGARGEA